MTRSHRSQRRVHTALACTRDAPSVPPLQHDARGCHMDSIQDFSSSAAIRATHDSHGRDKSSIDGRQPWRESYLIWGIYSAGRTEKVGAARDSFYRSHTPLPLHFVHVNTTHLSSS
jgi:hypothetical protein